MLAKHRYLNCLLEALEMPTLGLRLPQVNLEIFPKEKRNRTVYLCF